MNAFTCFLIVSLFTIPAWCSSGLRCLYISERAGAAVYNQPTLNSKNVFTLPYGTLVKVEEFTGKMETVKLNREKAKAQWLKINIPDSGNIKNELYLLDTYASPFLKEIPPAQLAAYDFLNLKDSCIIEKGTVYYNTLFKMPYGNMNRIYDSSLCGCFSYGLILLYLMV